MIWEEEEFEFDKEKRMKKYIKGELMSYYLLKSRWYELLDKKYFLYHKSPGGSIDTSSHIPKSPCIAIRLSNPSNF